MATSLNQGNIPPLPGVLVSRPGDRMLGSRSAASDASQVATSKRPGLLGALDAASAAIEAALSVEVSRYRSVELTVAGQRIREALALAENGGGQDTEEKR